MRVALLTTIEDFDDAYSVKRIVVDQVAMLAKAGHEVVLYVKQGFRPIYGTLPCIAVKQLPGFMHLDYARTSGEFLERFGGGELAGYDAVLTHDLYFLDTHQGYRDGIRRVAPETTAKWIRWSHSVPRPLQGDTAGIPGHTYVALNQEDIPYVADMYKIGVEQVDVCRNPSDVTDVVSPETAAFVNEFDLLNAGFLGVLPFSIGRLDQKGIEKAVPYYAEISKQGFDVNLVLCSSRCDKNPKDLALWEDRFKEVVEGTRCRVIWMPRARPKWAGTTPNRVVRELMAFSNLMIYPTIGEACSLAIAEAKTSGGPFLVLPESRVHGMRELADEDVFLCYWQDGFWKDKRPRSAADVAREILDQDLGRYVRRLRRQWEWSRAGIWALQLKPLLERRCPGSW